MLNQFASRRRFRTSFVALLVGSAVVGGPFVSSPVEAVGNSWTSVALPPSAQANFAAPRDMVTGNGKVMIVGFEVDAYNSVVNNGNNIWVANQSNLQFTGVSIETGAMLTDVAYWNGNFIATGETANWPPQSVLVTSSDDGATWTNRTASLPAGFNLFNTGQLTVQNGQVYLLGWNDIPGYGNRHVAIAKSSDLVNWTIQMQLVQDINQTPSSMWGSSFAINGSTIVVAPSPSSMGQSSLVVSADGGATVRWGTGADNPFTVGGQPADGLTSVQAPNYPAMAYGAGKFLGIGFNRTNTPSTPSFVATSTNGLDWTESQSNPFTGFDNIGYTRAFSYTGGKFVLVGMDGYVMSTDGVQWTGNTWAAGFPDTAPGGTSPDISNYVTSGSVTAILGTRFDQPWGTMVGTVALLNISAVPPTVTGVNPSSGSTAGGTSITITGTGFAAGATVNVGGVACTNVNVVSATSITCTTPAGSAGTASVVVTAGGQSSVANTLFTYAAPPTTTVPPTTTAPTPTAPTTTAPTTTAPAATPTLVNSSNQSQLTRQPGSATALVNGQPVTPVVETPADLPAAQVDPEDRSPAQVQSLQTAADDLVSQLNQSAGGNSGLAVVDTPAGANLTGLLTVPVPIENTVLVEAGSKSTLFAALNQDGSVTEVQPGAVIEVLGNGQVGVLASGLTPGETVEFVVMSTPTLLGTYTVGANGTIKTQAALPTGIGLGNHTLVVASPTVQASLGLKVTAGALPATGVDSSRGPISVALWLLAGGAFVVVLRRRRLIVD